MGSHFEKEKYAKAISTITANYSGRDVEAVQRSIGSRFPSKKVCELAGNSPEYQQHVIGRAANGDKNPFRMIAAILLVYDTVAFREVNSRLYRAVGLIRNEPNLLKRAVQQKKGPDPTVC